MSKMLIGLVVGFLLWGVMPASAQIYCTSNGACGYTATSSTCCAGGSVTIASGGCCYTTDDSYAATVAKWAVDLQLRGWLGKKGEELTREDVKDRRTKLDVLRDWAKKEVENKVFAGAYLRWADGMQSTLDVANNRLDHDEIASALLLHGLPSVPANAK